MDNLLLLILIIIGNLSLYWILFGKKRFENKHMKEKLENNFSIVNKGTPTLFTKIKRGKN